MVSPAQRSAIFLRWPASSTDLQPNTVPLSKPMWTGSVILRWAAGNAHRVQTYAAELVSLKPDVILAYAPTVLAALRHETQTIPIVFVSVADPVVQRCLPAPFFFTFTAVWSPPCQCTIISICSASTRTTISLKAARIPLACRRRCRKRPGECEIGAELHQLLPLHLSQGHCLPPLDSSDFGFDPVYDLQRLIPAPLELRRRMRGLEARPLQRQLQLPLAADDRRAASKPATPLSRRHDRHASRRMKCGARCRWAWLTDEGV
jgi:hypothetical protein